MPWLRRVEAFYARHPDLEGEIKPHFLSVLESDDPEVRDAMFAGTPFDQIELPSAPAPRIDRSREWSGEDQDVIDYLQHHHFSLPDRLSFVEDAIERLRSQRFRSSPVKCPACDEDIA